VNFPNETAVTVYHLPTTKSGSTQPYPTTGTTVSVCLLPMDRKNHALEGLVLVNPFEIYAEATEDIRVGDKIMISQGTYAGTYYCKKIFTADFGGLAHRRCSVSLEV
jgi:hypothetical protein